MGDDPADSMCIFKTIMGPGEADESCEIADVVGEVAEVQGADVNDTIINTEKQSDEDRALEEQIMGLAAGLNVQSGGVPNVDELLQVILFFIQTLYNFKLIFCKKYLLIT